MTLDILAAKDAIRELTARYCTAVIAGDGAGLAGLFVEGGGIEARGQVPIRGREALSRYIGAIPPGAILPLIHNHVIAVNGDEARGTCIVESRIGLPPVGGFVARYFDTYRRVGDDWRFVHRDIEYLYSELGGQVPDLLR